MDNMNMDNMKIILEHPVGGHPVVWDALNLHPLAEAALLSKHTIVDPHVVHVHVVHAVHAQAEGGGEETVAGGHLPLGHLPVRHLPFRHLPVRHLPVAGHDIVEPHPVVVEGHSISVHVAFHLEHVVVDERGEVHHVGGHLGAHHTGLDGRAGEAVVLLLVVAHYTARHVAVGHVPAGHLLVGHVLVLTHDPESLVVSHVLHLLAEAVAVDIRVVTLDSGLGVANLELLRVAVCVAVGVVAKVVLLVVLVDTLINVLPVLAAHGHLLVAHPHAGHLPVGHVHAGHLAVSHVHVGVLATVP